MKIWKKNAVVATVMLFVCVAVYLNWSYNRGNDLNDTQVDDGKKYLGDTSLVSGGEGDDSSIVLNPAGADDQAAGEQNPGASDYFDNARLTRQQARDSAISILKNSAESSDASQEVRDEAIAEVNLTASNALKEAKIENLVVAKGFRDCVAFINEGEVNLVVASPAEGLEASDVAKITEIVKTEAGVSADKIHVVEIKE
ncbi:SpoIIIAH-like family protein [Oscillospiraceae bacterium OttesenSCG-928-G22]|nr:SpoIIIAH-like family protein [Oscillospiraceae bacterium OttesenSCG-928-G22]